MTCPLYIVDAFTTEPFAGNPAAVCLLETPRALDWMQQVAAELNLSETAFPVPRAPGEWDLRWFTPRVEVSLCGHATLATAHVLWRSGEARDRLTFHTASGPLTAMREGNAIRLDFPTHPPRPTDPPPGLLEALGVEAQYVGRSREDILVAVASAAQVRTLQPDLGRLGTVDARGVMVTAPGDRPDLDFVSRFFAPAVGIPEDPVTGAAHCCLGPYWGERLGRDTLRGFQASPRGGAVEVRLAGERVHLLGEAVTVLEGRLHG